MKTISMVKKNIIGRVICLLFVISLGVGEVISLGRIKLSYLSTALFFIYSILIERKQGFFRNTKCINFLFFLVIWIAYALFQVLWSSDINLWLSFFRTLALNVLIVFLLINYIESYKDWLFVSRSFLLLILLCLIIGIWEYRSSQHLVFMDYEEMNENTALLVANKPLSFFGNINDNSSVLFLGLIVALVLFSQKKVKHFAQLAIRFLLLFLIVFEIIIINARAVTYSVFLLLFGILYFYVVSALAKSNQFKIRRIIVFTVLFLGCIITLALLFHPIDYYVSLISSGTDYSSDIGRLLIIRNGFHAFAKTGGFGLGPGQSLLVSNINLHSFYLEVLFEYGIFIGGFFVFMLFKFTFDKSRSLNRIADCTIRCFPLILILVGVSSSKLFSIRPFWITFCILFLAKYGLYKFETSQYINNLSIYKAIRNRINEY